MTFSSNKNIVSLLWCQTYQVLDNILSQKVVDILNFDNEEQKKASEYTIKTIHIRLTQICNNTAQDRSRTFLGQCER